MSHHLLTLAILLFGSQTILADRLSERAMLVRCYAHLTGQRIPSNHAYWAQLGNQRAAKLCLDLLNGTTIAADGFVRGTEQQLVLKQLNYFHRTWFNKQFHTNAEFFEQDYGTPDIHEATEGALFLSRALFGDNAKYWDVLRGTDALEAIRNPSTANSYGSNSTKRVTRMYITDNPTGSFDWSVPQIAVAPNFVIAPPYTSTPAALIAVGALTGIRTRSQVDMVPTIYTSFANGGAILNDATLEVPQPLRRNYGGGVLGSQPFLLYNFGHALTYRADGAEKLPRNWVVAAYRTFLCKEGPYLLASDVTAHRLNSAAGVPAFRTQTSCLQCHSSMDQAALTARNLTPASNAGFTTDGQVRLTALIANFAVTRGPEAGQSAWPDRAVASIRNQAPNGTFLFRSYNGGLISRGLTSVNDLGVAMSSTEDYYACAAKRYIRYFTGVNVRLNESEGAAFTARESKWREFAIALGKELQATGSLKTMIRRIIESDFYHQKDFGR